jgi:hypothetical protein
MLDISLRLRQTMNWADLNLLLPALGQLTPKGAAALAKALLRLAGASVHGLNVNPVVLGRLAVCLAEQNIRLSHPGWQRIGEALAAGAVAALMAGDRVPVLATVAVLSTSRGYDAAMRWLLTTLPALPATAPADAAVHEALWHLGLLRAVPSMTNWVAGLPTPQRGRVLVLLGLLARRPMTYTRMLVEALALPWMQQSARAGDAEAALWLEGMLIEYWLKRDEAEDHYARWIGAWAPLLAQLGQAARLKAPLLPVPDLRVPRRLAFIVHNGVLLAHTQVLLLALQRLNQRGDAGFIPQVWTLGGMDARFRQAFTAAGAELRSLEDLCPEQGFTGRLHRLRQELAAEGTGGAIWLCLPHLLSYAAGLGIVPRLGWWSLKYHPPLAGPDLRLCQAGGEPMAPVEIRGQSWHVLPLAFQAAPPDDAARAAAGRLRATLPAAQVVLSTVMRTDKMDSPEFWETMVSILQQAPQALWRYAGQHDLPGLRDCLERHGVAGRAHFAGWVDPAVEAALADIYIDGWPVGSGATAAQAMMAGIPYVFRAADAAMDGATGVMDHLWLLPRRRGLLGPAAEARFSQSFQEAGASLLRIPRTAAEQADWALALIADPALRHRTGAAFARFAADHVCNPDRLAEGLRQAAKRLFDVAPGHANNHCLKVAAER